MRKSFLWVGIAVIALVGCAKPESLVMRPTTSPEGWSGNAFYRNNIIASEEFSSGKNGPAVDVWRFYDGYGRLYTEERDTTGNGVRNLYRAYDKEGVLVMQKEDTNGDGVYDKVTDYTKKRANAPKVTSTYDPTLNRDRHSNQQVKKQSEKRHYTAKVSKKSKKRPSAAKSAQPTLETVRTAPAAAPQPAAPAPVTEPAYQPTAAPTPVVTQEAKREAPATRENFIRPVPLPAAGYADSANANSRVVPGPVFHHPSDDLED